jgi:quercetin dioxygenase-like cupin family protein
LKEYLTKTDAFLLCVSGEVLFENEQSESVRLKAGDFLEIEAMVKHWVKGVQTSHLILVK